MSNKADKNIDPVVQVQREANAATNAVERERLRGKPTQPVSVYADPGSSNKIENVVRAADKVLTDLGLPPHRFEASQNAGGRSGGHGPPDGADGTFETDHTAEQEFEDGPLGSVAPDDSVPSHAAGSHSQTQSKFTSEPSINDASGISTIDWAKK